MIKHGTVAQLVERLPEEQRVGGSNPSSSTKFQQEENISSPSPQCPPLAEGFFISSFGGKLLRGGKYA